MKKILFLFAFCACFVSRIFAQIPQAVVNPGIYDSSIFNNLYSNQAFRNKFTAVIEGADTVTYFVDLYGVKSLKFAQVADTSGGGGSVNIYNSDGEIPDGVSRHVLLGVNTVLNFYHPSLFEAISIYTGIDSAGASGLVGITSPDGFSNVRVNNTDSRIWNVSNTLVLLEDSTTTTNKVVTGFTQTAPTVNEFITRGYERGKVPLGTFNADVLSYNPTTSAYLAVPANRSTFTSGAGDITPAESVSTIISTNTTTGSEIHLNYTPDSRFNDPFTTFRYIHNAGTDVLELDTNQAWQFRDNTGTDSATFNVTAGTSVKLVWDSSITRFWVFEF